jgi:hypothetical protein
MMAERWRCARPFRAGRTPSWDHILLSDERRAALLAAVAAAIERHSGVIRLAYRTWLCLGRRRSR